MDGIIRISDETVAVPKLIRITFVGFNVNMTRISRKKVAMLPPLNLLCFLYILYDVLTNPNIKRFQHAGN